MGRGSSGMGENPMSVDWDKWGEIINYEPIEITDENGERIVIGHIQDELRSITVPEERPVTKAEVMKDIQDWKNDDGSYGDEDVHIFVAYDDGTFFTNDWSGSRGGNIYRDKLKKTGVIGASISTGDYEMVWGGDKGKNGEIRKWETWSSDGESGKSNTYSGYKTTGMYRVRVKRTYNERFPNGRIHPKIEIIRKSKVKKVD